jgi:hypothetical protein
MESGALLAEGRGEVEDLVAQPGQADHVVEEGDCFELVRAEDGVVGVYGGWGGAACGQEGFRTVVFGRAGCGAAGAGVSRRLCRMFWWP